MQNKIKVNTFAAFHYDVAYQKTFSGYLDQSLRIIDTGLALLAQYPQYVFAIEQVLLAREYVRRNPSVLPAMRRWAREGRLVFLPGMFTMPDVNLPNGESFVRNYLIGRQWLKENLGIEPKICWMADIFGHHPQMPQFAKLCGYVGYLFERGKREGDDTPFWWEGLDGSRILTQWEIDTYYGLGIPLNAAQMGIQWKADYADNELLNLLRDNSKTAQTLLAPIGGDFRNPREDDVTFVREYNRLARGYKLVFASPEHYFEEIHRREKEQLPTLKSDFNPLMQGVYSSRIRLKQANRRLENLAFAIALLESTDAADPQPDRRYSDQLWEKIAWNAFHDIICGTLVDEALREALRDYAQAEDEARERLADLIVSQTPNSSRPFKAPADHVVALYNPLAYARGELVEIPVKTPGTTVKSIAVIAADGRPMESQLIVHGAEKTDPADQQANEADAASIKEPSVSVLINIPMAPAAIRSVGLRLNGKIRPRKDQGPLLVRENLLENDRLRAVLGPNGTIVSLIDKDNGVELVQPTGGPAGQTGLNNFIRQNDMGDLWSCYNKPTNGSLLYTAELHDPMPNCELHLRRKGGVGSGSSDVNAYRARIRIVERGPLRAMLEVSYPEMCVTTWVSLARHEKMLRFETRMIPSGKHWRLRVAFPTNIRNGIIRRSIPCGFVRQPEGEYPAQDWLDYADEDKGLCLLNRGLPGNNVTDGVMFLSLFRAVAMEDRDSQPWYEEGQEHVFEYALRPFSPAERDYHPARLGAQFNQPIRHAFVDGDRVPAMAPLCAMQGAGAEWMSFRQLGKGVAELRLHESEGRATEIELVFPGKIRHCLKTDFNGKVVNRKDVQIRGARAKIRLRPFEIANLQLAL